MAKSKQVLLLNPAFIKEQALGLARILDKRHTGTRVA